MIRSASALERHCAHAVVIKAGKPKSASLQAAGDRGTNFHSAVQKWIETGSVPEMDDVEMMGWLDLLHANWTPPPGTVCEWMWGLGEDGSYVVVTEPQPHVYEGMAGSARLLTAGRADIVCWSRSEQDIIDIIDWKTGRYSAPPANENLQVHAAGLALMGGGRVRGYQPRVYYVRAGYFDDGDVVYRGSSEHAIAMEDVRKAALLDDQPHTGEHCFNCWERKNCAAFQHMEACPF